MSIIVNAAFANYSYLRFWETKSPEGENQFSV